MKFSIDSEYLHELLIRYESLNENKVKEKVNVRNSIIELLQPCATAILLTYRKPLDWDMSQDLMENLINQVEHWDSSRCNGKKSGKPNDLGFFVTCIHNFCKNYLKKESTRNRREMLVNPIEQPFWESLPSWELPSEINITPKCIFAKYTLQKAYEHCLELLLGNQKRPEGDTITKINLTKEIRDKFKLTYENTKIVLTLAEQTIREGIDNGC